MKCFQTLQLWVDPLERAGPEAMAVDEWLLETAVTPVLRVYRWLGNWASVGYFGALDQAMAAFPGVCWVRRWTGGGTVDHRADWTYTVVAPAGEALAAQRGADSYRILHAALAAALGVEGIEARLSAGAETTGAALCFDNPVSHDLIGSGGRKLAGAGQRRTPPRPAAPGVGGGECHPRGVPPPRRGARRLPGARLDRQRIPPAAGGHRAENRRALWPQDLDRAALSARGQ